MYNDVIVHMNLEKIVSTFSGRVSRPLGSLAKVALRSHRPSPRGELKQRPVVVMGNGPSLRSFIDTVADGLHDSMDFLAVNFAAITPEYRTLRPDIYVLADPHFFNAAGEDQNVVSLWESLRATTWRMTLWLPAERRKLAWALTAGLPGNVEVKYFNLTPVEGRGALTRFLIHNGLGMPRPRNVLIPAIMTALREGYRELYLVGADHTWSRTLGVDDRNRVVSIQPHFYKDSKEESRRVATEYEGYHLHDILQSLTVAFRSYFDIRDYAQTLGATITNATPGSFIDAFPRCGYGQMKTRSMK